MATSLDDLLAAVDEVSRATCDPADASAALHWSARLIDRVREHESLLGEPSRAAAARHLADACRYASISFAGHAGCGSDLVAVTHDGVGRLHGELTAEDSWAIVTRLAMADRRWAATIARSGPYGAVPELLAVGDRAREVLIRAAERPLELDRLRALDQPIPAIVPASGGTVSIAAAELVGELCRASRDPMSMREITAACHAAYQLAAYAAVAVRTCEPPIAAAAHETAQNWTAVRETVALYRDAAPRRPSGSVFDRAIALDAAVRHRLVDPCELPVVTDAELRMANRQLDRIAEACADEITKTGPQLIVPHGPRPLSEQRVGQWLCHQPFVAAPCDVRPAIDALLGARGGVDRFLGCVAHREVGPIHSAIDAGVLAAAPSVLL